MQKISIVTVVFNRRIDLERTILSCIRQTYPYKEYIVVDGGSNDGTVNVIQNYQNNIDFWISEPDNGIFNAMNKSLSFVSGEYVIFMNAGDVFFSEETLEKVFGNKEYEENIIYGHSVLHNKYGYLLRKSQSIYERVNTGKDYVYKGQGICHQSLFTRVEILKRIKFNENYKLGADYDTTATIIRNNPKSYYDLGFPICIFDDLSGGASHRQLKRVIDERLVMFNCTKDFFYYSFLVSNFLNTIFRDSISTLFPGLKRRYISKKYSTSLTDLCV